MVRRADKAAQSKTYDLDPGLYLVRYDVAADQARPPVITVLAEGRARDIEIITEPGGENAELARPGDALVVRVEAAAGIRVEMSSTRATDASVQIERLGNVPAPPARRATRRAANEAAPADVARTADEFVRAAGGFARRGDGTALEVVGHLARRGDVPAASGEWLGGPGDPVQIEGVLLSWPASSAELRYAVKVGGRTPRSIGPVGQGEFVGTKGRALGLTEVTIEIEGEGSEEIAVEALFHSGKGNPVPVASKGRQVSVSGPTGREILVGLKVTVAAAKARPVESTTTSSSRVRIFRGRDHQRQASGRSN